MYTLKQNWLAQPLANLIIRYKATLTSLRPLLRSAGLRIHQGAVSVRRHRLITLAATTSLITVSLASSVILKPTVKLGFAASESCAGKIILLPGWHRVTSGNGYRIALRDTISVGGWDLLSRSTCTAATEAPLENSSSFVQYSLFGNKLLQQSIKISTPTFPQLNTEPLTSQPVSAKKALQLNLSEADVLFDYRISANGQSVTCDKDGHILYCPTEPLKLMQGQAYEARVERLFGGRSAYEIFAGTIHTADPVEITETSIVDDGIAYQPVTELKITTNQPLKNYESVSLVKIADGKTGAVAVKTELSGNQLIIKLEQPLPWRTSYKLSVDGLQSTDNGELNQPYSMEFKTPNGPIVLSANIANYGVLTTQSFELKFDQNLASPQDIWQKVNLTGPAGVEAVTMQINGSRLVVKPNRSLPHCTTFTLKTNDSITNAYNVSGDSAWSRQFRTKCAVISAIGYSVEGRPILAYSFGSGSSKVVYVGAMHGTEQSSKYLLDSWIGELEAHPERIPAHRTIVVIPNSNPDGVVRSRRTNMHNVDLNRNFPANDWTAGVYMPGQVFEPQGGGTEPLSEPESKALANYVKGISPRLVLTYHSSAAVVIGNDAGDASSLAAVYAAKSRYSVANDSQADDIFSYTTTGEFEDWLHDKLGIPTLLIELASLRGNEFSRNKDALWAMASLP